MSIFLSAVIFLSFVVHVRPVGWFCFMIFVVVHLLLFLFFSFDQFILFCFCQLQHTLMFYYHRLFVVLFFIACV